MSERSNLQMNSQASVESVLAGLRARGVRRVFVKHLAHNDNEKNQIYLAPSLDGLVRALNATLVYGSRSESAHKPDSRVGKPKLIAPLDWVWIGGGPDAPAPNTKLIHYFQYPEVRLSGFLSGCLNPPDALRRNRLDGYGERWLLFGSDGARTYGGVLTAERGGALPPLDVARPSEISDCLSEVWLETTKDTSAAIKELLDVWHPCIRLPAIGNTVIPFKGPQGAGYTLEALMGVPTNAIPGPDHAGSELKTFRFGGRVTLMTPVADGGLEQQLGARKFIERFGHIGRDGQSLRFTGTHRVGQTTNGRTLVLRGMAQHVLETTSVDLVQVSDGRVLAGWSLGHLSGSWLKKHDSAFYVEYEKDRDRNLVRYLGYYRCRHTSPERLLNAIHEGLVVYDPAHTIKNGKLKVRPQWRISSSRKTMEATLRRLYRSVDWHPPT